MINLTKCAQSFKACEQARQWELPCEMSFELVRRSVSLEEKATLLRHAVDDSAWLCIWEGLKTPGV